MAKVAQALNCNSEELKQPKVHFTQVDHEDLCGQVAITLKEYFPDASVYRDFQLPKSPDLEKVLVEFKEEDRKLLPDVTMIVPRMDGAELKIAFEVELTKKSRERNALKVRKYLTESFFDYVVYLIRDHKVEEEIFEWARIMKIGRRKLFEEPKTQFYFGNLLKKKRRLVIEQFGEGKVEVSFKDWISKKLEEKIRLKGNQAETETQEKLNS